jgi:parallel beta-helix repeat protein
MNGRWTNGTTTTFLNTSVGEGGWANITVCGWKASGTGKLSTGCISDEVQAPGTPTAAPNIISLAPPTPVSNTAGATRTFGITIDQIVNVTWYINGTNVQDTNTSVTAANYTNTNAEIGVWNVSALAENVNGTDMQTWVWNVAATAPPTTPCDCGDICVNTSGWWRNNNAFNANTMTPIQAAVDDATAGETICVGAGSYRENVDVNKRVTLTCEGVGVVTVTAASASDHVFEVTADYVNISGFYMTRAKGAGKAGIYLKGGQHCNISDNTANSNNYGIFLSYSSNYNTLLGNTANSNKDCGIGLHSSSSNTLLGNTANSNDNFGIGIYSSSSNTLLCNTVDSNYYGIGLHSSSNNLIYNNYFDNINNAYDNGNNIWNTTPAEGTNIIGGSWLGGNCWSDYAGADTAGDGLGDTLTPYNSAGNIVNVGDYHPLVTSGFAAPNITSFAPESPVNDTYCTWRTFSVTIDQTVNVTWHLNGIPQIPENVSVTEASYTFHADDIRGHNISAVSQAAKGIDIQTWVWNVTATAPPPCGDICVNTSGWWRNNNAFNANATTPIQAAVDDADGGDTICVWAGDYSENVNVNKRLTLVGAGVVTVTAASVSDHVFEVTADYVNISGFNVTGACTDMAGIYLKGGQHCNISDNTANSNYYGIFLHSSSSNTLLDNTANSNNGCGICLYSSSSNTLLNNTANSNHDPGIFLSYSSNYNTLLNNTANSNYNLGISLYSSSSNTLLGNTANSNNYGIFLHSSSNNLIYNNYWSNTNNAYDNGNNIWNTTPTEGTNIISGSWLGGNYWSDYTGADTAGDGLGDTLTPYNASGNIVDVGDCHPLVTSGFVAPAITSRGNNITNDGSAIITINEAVAIRFNATADQTITTWNWNNDGTPVRSNNFDNYTTCWDVKGTHIVSLNATNANGVSGTKTWTVTVQSSSGVATIAIGDASDNATIPIVVENGVNVGACDITLSFNASVVNVTDVADGDFDITIPNVVQVREGLVRIGVFQTGNPGLNGRITLANVTFTSMRHPTGTESPLNLSVTTFKEATPAGDEMPYIIRNGNYTTVTNGDINDDGKVDFQDAAFLAKHVVGIPGFENIIEGAADVDGNGLIDLADVMYLARHLLRVSGYEELR